MVILLGNQGKPGTRPGSVAGGGRSALTSPTTRNGRMGTSPRRPGGVGGGSPNHAWRIPRVVSEWLDKTALTGAERIWFVMDCGSEIGNAAGYNRQLAAQKQLQYMGTAQIIMPENYIAMFNAPQKEQARSIVEQAEPALQKVLAQLKAGQEFPRQETTSMTAL